MPDLLTGLAGALGPHADRRTRELEQRNRVAESLRDTLTILNSDRPLDEILMHIVSQARELMDASACILHQVDVEQDLVRLRAHSGYPAELTEPADGLFSTAGERYKNLILNRRVFYDNYLPYPERVEAIRDDPDLSPDRRHHLLLIRERYAASLSVPLVIKETVYGCLIFYYDTAQEFLQEQIDLASTFSEQAALAIENARLHQAEHDRRREAEQGRLVAESLRDTLKHLNAHKPLQEILDHVVSQAQSLMGAGACVLHKVDLRTGLACWQASSGWPTELLVETAGQIDTFGSLYRHAVEQQQSTYANYPPLPERLAEVENDPDISPEVRRRRLIIRTRFAASLNLPLVINGEVYGCLIFYYEQPQDFPPEQVNQAAMFAEQAALAIQNARLQQAEHDRRMESEQRRRVAEGLRDILAILNSNRPLGEILRHIVMQADYLLGSAAGVIYRLDRRHRRIVVEAEHGVPESFKALKGIPLYPGGNIQHIMEYEPYTISDLQEHLSKIVPGGNFRVLPDPDLGCWLEILHTNYRAYLGVPLLVDNEIYGCLGLYYEEVRRFTEEEIRLGFAFGDQAALAIENARLYEQMQESAAMAERNRLARELHDSVTQTLFSASLIAKVLPRLWERNEEEGWRRLEELHQLTRGALAEMRALLIELRPAALVDTDLAQLLRHLVEAAAGRIGIPVDFSMEGVCAVEGDAKVAIYRIAQELLNNVAKHADASHVDVRLLSSDSVMVLTIRDDGKGFVPAQVTGDHFGLGIMLERARAVGASLTVESQPGDGTLVTLVCPQRGEASDVQTSYSSLDRG